MIENWIYINFFYYYILDNVNIIYDFLWIVDINSILCFEMVYIDFNGNGLKNIF